MMKHNAGFSLCLPLAQRHKTPGLRPLTREDIPGALNLLQTHFLESGLSPALSPQEAEHWLVPRENVMHSYVVEVHPFADLRNVGVVVLVWR